MNNVAMGKKIFFLYPQSVIQEDLIFFLLGKGYEVYTLSDHIKAQKLFKRFEDSICFINIDGGLKESDWEKYIIDLRSDSEIKNLQIGILSYNSEQTLMKKYLIDIGVECGFVQLKLGLEPSQEILLKVLKVSEAKGQRKFVRVSCEDDSRAVINFTYGDSRYEGQIIDLSIVGFACRFTDRIPVENKTVIHGIQFNLRGVLFQTDAIILNRRSDDERIAVLIFHPEPGETEHQKLYKFIHFTLQNHINMF